jgi:O-antigen/teichoic acid export membrane protein
MSEPKRQLNPEAGHAHKAFFRQSGWLMIASIGSGLLFYLVHLLSKRITVAEYGAFGVMLAMAMCVPNMPLQMVFAQQTAQALAKGRERALGAMIRLASLGVLLFALLLAAALAIWHDPLLAAWKLPSVAGLWFALVVVVLTFWLPMFMGVLQGQQNFLWLGWVNILNAVGRLSIAAGLVLFFAGASTEMIAGVAVGLAMAVGVGIWQTRELWRLPGESFQIRELLGQIMPLMLGFGAVQFLFSADTLFVKAYFTGDESGFYVSAGTLSRALLWLVLPLATVMFPKLVQSAARSEKSNLLGLVMLGTAVLAAGGAVGLTILGPWVVKLAFKDSYVQVAAAVLPWYAWAMVPLSLANALVNSLLARGQFRIVPALIVLAVAYGVALTQFHGSLKTVLQTLGVFNVLLLLVCLWFTWRKPLEAKPEGLKEQRGA